MAKILTISSDVVYGHVGNAASVFTLRRMGHEVWSIPTVILSNHPGHPNMAGHQLDPQTGHAIVNALNANGWLGSVDAILTGYLPTPDHVDVAIAAIRTARRAGADPKVLVDPILGDEPKGLYLPVEAANALRNSLLPEADITTPNHFELGWLTGPDNRPAVESLCERIAALDVPLTMVTSVPRPSATQLATVIQGAGECWATLQHRRADVPNGAGDLIAALLLGHLLPPTRSSAKNALGLAVGALEAVLDLSRHCDTLQISADGGSWVSSRLWQVQAYDTLASERTHDAQ